MNGSNAIDISIIMSVYDESKIQLEHSIGSIIRQSYSQFELIIILDNPANIEAKKFINEYTKKDSRIVFLQNKANLKLGASLNKGIKHARGKYIGRMDGDDTCDAFKFQTQFEFLQNNPDIDLLFTGWREVDEKGNVFIRLPTKNQFQNLHHTFFYKSPILHASMLCKKEIFQKYSYPEIDRPEDFALFLKLIHAGYKFDIIPKQLYTFYVDSYNVEKKFNKIHIFSQNFLHIMGKNIPLYWNNIFFWWMFFISFVQYMLSRNKLIFILFFNTLQKIYKLIFQ